MGNDMDLYSIVYQLISENDCVIIPQFGGFIVNYAGATVNIKTQEFCPPSRRLAFNESLRDNDGLLLNYLCRHAGMSWQAAENHVGDFVQHLNNELVTNRIARFDYLGTFTREEGCLRFTPLENLNIAPQFYGFPRFHYPMLQDEKPVNQILTQNLGKIKKVKTHKSKKRVLLIVTSAAAALALVFYFAHPAFDNAPTPTTTEYAKVVPIDNPQTTVTTAVSTSDDNIVAPTTEADIVEIAPTDEPAEAAIAEVVDTEIVTTPEVVVQTNNVYIIAGCFAEKQNAINLQSELTGKGFASELLPMNNGMTRVTVKSFANTKLASAELDELKTATGNDSLWIYKF